MISIDINEKLDIIMNMQKNIMKKLEEHDKKFNAIDQKFDSIDKRFDAIDQRLDILTGSNREEHEKIMVLITSLEGKVKNHSYRISNLEKAI